MAGDEKYGDAGFNETLRGLGLRRMFLHAHSVSFAWPQGGEFSINTPLPAELGAVLDRLATMKKPARGRSWPRAIRRARQTSTPAARPRPSETLPAPLPPPVPRPRPRQRRDRDPRPPASALGQRQTGAPQRAREPDERQPDEGGGIGAVDAFKERDPEASALKPPAQSYGCSRAT